jgi:phage protein D
MAAKAYQITLGDEAVAEDFYGDVVSLEVEESTDLPGTLRLRLRLSLGEDGEWDYLADDRLAPFQAVKVAVGFTGGQGLAGALGGLLGSGGDDGLVPVFQGFITGVSLALGSEPGNSYLDVTAMDHCVLLSLEEKVASWPNLSDSDIVRQIMSGYAVDSQIDATAPTPQEDDRVVIQRGTDIQFVRGLARKNGLEFYFETDKESGSALAHFQAPQLDGTPQPDLAIRFGDQSNLRSLSVRQTGLRPLSVKVRQLDAKADSVNEAQASDVQLAELGDKSLAVLAGGTLDGLVTPKDTQALMLLLASPTSDATELQTIAQAVRDEAGWFLAAQGEVNTEAYQAVLRPRRLVLIKGAGAAYSGKYYVTRVVHALRDDGSYTQKFEARRNARDLHGTESFGGGNAGLSLPGI